jgi:citrate lyase subunit beta/citryl-CoA lyase
MPKTETADEVREVEAEIERVEKELGCEGRTLIMAAIESALGIVNAYNIATASKRMMGIALGAEDYSANLKTQRTKEGTELQLARETIVVAARAAGIDALDTVFSNLNDMDAFRAEVELIKRCGIRWEIYHQSAANRNRQRVFAPKEKDIEKARIILAAMKEAAERGAVCCR